MTQDFIRDGTALWTDKTDRYPVSSESKQWDAAAIALAKAALLSIQTYLRTGTFDLASATIPTLTSTTATVTNATVTNMTVQDVNLIADAVAGVGPEQDWKGFNGRWFVGVDVANSPTSRDFVLAGIRGTYSFGDGATTSGSATLTSATGDGFTTALIGSAISGSGIPNGTTIIGVGGATSLTMSALATATAGSVQVTITRNTNSDILYLKHRGAQSPTFGVGVTPPDGSARLQISADDAEVAMGTVRVRVGASQTGKAITVHDSNPTDRVWIDKDFYLTGNHPTTSGAIAISADATNQHALTLTDSTKTNFYSFDTPTGSGGVLRVRCQSGGASCFDLGTDGSFRHLSTKIGFYGATTAVKPTVTGSRGGNAALASLLTALSGLGLITDSTTA